MNQQWFSVAGLSLDIIGFGLIVYEWLHAAKEIEWEKMDIFTRPQIEWRLALVRDQDNKKIKIARTPWENFRFRKRFFVTGAVLVSLGFLLQILGNWPGGVPVFGIVDPSALSN